MPLHFVESTDITRLLFISRDQSIGRLSNNTLFMTYIDSLAAISGTTSNEVAGELQTLIQRKLDTLNKESQQLDHALASCESISMAEYVEQAKSRIVSNRERIEALGDLQHKLLLAYAPPQQPMRRLSTKELIIRLSEWND